MATSNTTKDQVHPQEASDGAIARSLLTEAPTDFNLAELARLRVRYRGFPGARVIQANLDAALTNWGLTEAELFEKTRAIHAIGNLYEVRARSKRNEEDWS